MGDQEADRRIWRTREEGERSEDLRKEQVLGAAL